ncbi:hypothetical protein SORBI_3008G181250 [Sorghum bicolor]|nr:hypothetical protein SORBI_3008G181250 [Sorghum bicolor]
MDVFAFVFFIHLVNIPMFMILQANSGHQCTRDGGDFKAIMTFLWNYPNSLPSIRFTSEMVHPNSSILGICSVARPMH